MHSYKYVNINSFTQFSDICSTQFAVQHLNILEQRIMSDSGRKVIHTDVDTGLSVVNDSGDEQDDEVTRSICNELFN